jgi:hypothetical protein
MSIRIDALGRLRAVALVVAASLLGIAVGTTFHPAPTEAVTTHTRAWSCHGRDFMPLDDEQPFGFWTAAAKAPGTSNAAPTCPTRRS